jgi:hypothetical protein
VLTNSDLQTAEHARSSPTWTFYHPEANMEFLDHPIALFMVGIISFPIYKSLAKIFFGEHFEDLAKTIKYVATADWYSLLKGRFWEDWDATAKFYIYIALCLGWVAAATELLAKTIL